MSLWNVIQQPSPPCIAWTASYEWHSPAMADGLRLLGSCPKCGGELAFAAAEPAHEAPDSPIMDGRAPHLVLGVPRR